MSTLTFSVDETISKAAKSMARSMNQIGKRDLGEIAQFCIEGSRDTLDATVNHDISRGILARSIGLERLSDDADFAEVSVGTNLPYARIRHKGGTILPVKGERLAIPINAKQGSQPSDFPRDSMMTVPNAKIELNGKEWYGLALVDKKPKTLKKIERAKAKLEAAQLRTGKAIAREQKASSLMTRAERAAKAKGSLAKLTAVARKTAAAGAAKLKTRAERKKRDDLGKKLQDSLAKDVKFALVKQSVQPERPYLPHDSSAISAKIIEVVSERLERRA